MIMPTLKNPACGFTNKCIIRDNLHHIAWAYLLITAIKILTLKLLSFTSLEQSSTFKNIAQFGDNVMTLTNGLRLVSIHPSEKMESLKLLPKA
jgi:hypothetical protein